jgi:hypothetical protein
MVAWWQAVRGYVCCYWLPAKQNTETMLVCKLDFITSETKRIVVGDVEACRTAQRRKPTHIESR